MKNTLKAVVGITLQITLLISLLITVLIAAGCKPKVGTDTSAKTPADPNAVATQVLHVDATAAKALLDQGGIEVLDIRTPEEFAAGHLANAINIDYRGSDFETEVGKLDRATNYLVHCQSGGRSTKSLPVFERLGFQQITHLDGGALGWEKAGFELVE